METKAKIVLIVFATLLLTGMATAFTIVDNNVVFENAQAKLVVTPFQVFQTKGKDINQTFFATNKTGASQPLYAAYYFDNPVQHAKVFLDNGNDVSSFFSQGTYHGKTIYYSTTPLTIGAGATRSWKISYLPSAQDKTGKWGLVLYSGASAGCILTSTCTAVFDLDPWWNNTFGYFKDVNISGAHSAIDTNYTFQMHVDFSQLIADGNILSTNANDWNDIRLVWRNSAEIDRNIAKLASTDWLVEWRAQEPIAANADYNASDTNGYRLYYGASDANAAPRNKMRVYWFFDDFNGSSITDNYAWTDGCSTTVASGIVTYSGNGACAVQLNKYTSDGNYFFDMNVRMTTANSSANNFAVGRYIDNDTRINFDFYADGGGGNDELIERIAGQSQLGAGTAGIFLNNVWYNVRLDLNGTKIASILAYQNGTIVSTSSNLATVPTGAPFFGFQGATNTSTIELDYILIRKLIQQNPSFFLGAQIQRGNTFTVDFNNVILSNSPTGSTFLFSSTSVPQTGETMTTFLWDVNGVTSGTNSTLSQFLPFGDWNVQLTASDSNGMTGVKSYLITSNRIPSNVGIVVSQNDNNSTDMNLHFVGSATGTVVTWTWEFADENKTGQSVDKNFNSAGTKNVCLYASNTSGVSRTCQNFYITSQTVKRPLDEQTPSLVLSPFAIVQNISTGFPNYSALNADTTFLVFTPNNSTFFSFQVDKNADYYARNYSFVGNGGTNTLQPYLLKKANATQVQVFAREASTANTLQGVVLTLSKNISGTIVPVQVETTDISGTATLSVVATDNYFLTVVYQGTTYFNQSVFNPTLTQYTVKLCVNIVGCNADSNSGTLNTKVDINYVPANSLVVPIGGLITLGETVSSPSASISALRLVVTNKRDGNVLYDSGTQNFGISVANYTFSIPPISSGGLTEGDTIVFTTTEVDSLGRTHTFTTNMAFSVSGVDPLAMITQSGQMLGQTASAVVALVVTMFIVLASVGVGIYEPRVLLMECAAMLTVFVVVGFLPWGMVALAIVFGIAAVLLPSGGY